MARTDNSGVSMDPIQFTYDNLHHLHSNFHYPGLPSTSTAHLDLPGFHCNIGPSHCYDTLTKNTHTRDFQRDSILYPSPPPTNSQPKRSVPLPSLSLNGDMGFCAPQSRHFGGILDSPVVVKHEALGCHAPLSPPPTIPTPTQALPPTDDTLPSISEQDDFDVPILGLPSPSSSPDHNGDAMHHLLSPLSPEWVTNQISSDMPSPHSEDDCVLLHGNQSVSSGNFDYIPDAFRHSSFASRPVLSLLDIPDSRYHMKKTWDEPLSSLMDSDSDDESALSTPLSPPSSPLPQKVSLIEPDVLFEDHYPDDKYPFFHHPRSPSIHHIRFLPELDDIPNSPSSPSLRSFSSLPELTMEDDDEEFLGPPSLSPSPGRTLLSLPGADIDDDLLPADLGLQSFIPPGVDPIPTTPLNNRSLLLLDDPNDVPPPRSPSPENFHLDPALLERCADPEVRHLYDLRKRSQAAERSARQLEARMLEDGSVHMRWEARRLRKREKERSREITAMLRLKLSEQGVLDDLELESHRSSKSSAISSMEHLVAKMLLRRNDTYRSLANRKTPFYDKHHTHSPLSRSFAAGSEDADDAGVGVEDMDMDEDEDSWPPVPVADGPRSRWISFTVTI